MPLTQLLPDVAGVPEDVVVSGLVLDSRDVRAGDAFVAIGGFGTHGLHFTTQAAAAGASAILFEPPVLADVPAPPAEAIAVPGLRARMGQRGRATVVASYSIDRMVDELERVYERVAGT